MKKTAQKDKKNGKRKAAKKGGKNTAKDGTKY